MMDTELDVSRFADGIGPAEVMTDLEQSKYQVKSDAVRHKALVLLILCDRIANGASASTGALRTNGINSPVGSCTTSSIRTTCAGSSRYLGCTTSTGRADS